MENPVYPRDILGLIEENDLDGAKKLLDEQVERDGQWHYFQSRLYIKKGWHNEAKKQLEIALKLEPDNQEYISESDKLNALGDAPPENKEEVRFEELNDKKSKKKCCSKDDCCLLGGECACECCATGLCEAICDGCS